MPIQRWRSPVALRVSWAVYALAGAALATVFFPAWLGVPAAVLIGGFYLGAAVLGAKVTVDSGAGLLTLRLGLISRRIRLTDVTAVLVDANKVSIGRGNGSEVSFYPWRRGLAGRWLRFPSVASDIGHAISSASALAKAAAEAPAASDHAPVTTADDPAASATATPVDDLAASATAIPANGPAASATATTPSKLRPRWRTVPRSRSRQATWLLVCVGAIELTAAFLVRLHWHNPVITVLAALLALLLGVAGLIHLLAAIALVLVDRVAAGLRKAKA